MSNPTDATYQHWLLTVDVDAVQSYVYESSRLPEVRGGSKILSALETDAGEQVVAGGGRVCCSAGGSLTACFDDRKQAEEAARAIRQLYLKRTLVATATTAVEGCDADPTRNSDAFRKARLRAKVRLQEKKFSRSTMPFFEVPSYAQRCASCDSRPAAKITETEPYRPICVACDIKLQEGRQLPGAVTTLAELNSGKAIGLVRLDGDGIGSQLAGKSWQELSRFSRHLRVALKRSMRVSLVGVSACQPVYVGGDDLVIFLPAQHALPVSLEIIRQFSRRAPAGCTLSGGVVIAHPHYPVHYLQELARELCDSAKRAKAVESSQAAVQEGWLDFEVLRSASAAGCTLRQLRSDRQDEYRGPRRLHDRPYRASDLRAVVEWTQELRNGSYRGQLRLLAQAAAEGTLQSSAFLLYQLARHGLLALKPLLAAYSDPPGWRARQCGGSANVLTTCLPDLADLYDCLEGG